MSAPTPTSSPAGQVQREGQVPTAIVNLNRLIGELSESIMSLQTKLDPVMRAIPTAVQSEKKSTPNVCALASVLGEKTDQINELRITIISMLERIEV